MIFPKKFNEQIWKSKEERDKYLALMYQEMPKQRQDFSCKDEINISQWHSLWAVFNAIRYKENISEKQSKLNSLVYPAYLQSGHWMKMRKKIFRRDGGRCRVCNSSKFLCVHHRSYREKGIVVEEEKDLCLLCKDCHELFHKHGRLQ